MHEWTCGYASATEAGDYYQVLFAETNPGDARYILIQSQFEFPENFDVKVETNNGEWYAELIVDCSTLNRHRLEINGSNDGEPVCIVINHSANDETYAELKLVLKTMLPDIDIRNESDC